MERYRAVDVSVLTPTLGVMEHGVDEVASEGPRLPSLSPSRAGDFKTCPLLYRFRVIDKLPETPSPAAVRGTLVHKVLEDLFDLPAAERTLDRASQLLGPSWEGLLELEGDLDALFAGEENRSAFFSSAEEVLARYFELEDPRRLEPAERELYVETEVDGLLVRGVIDRLDVAADGSVRVVDYKTSRSIREGREGAALFQLRVYGLILYRTRGVVPKVLQLIYLGNAETISYEPDLDDLLATERVLQAVRTAIAVAEETGDWQPRTSAMCGWCSFQALCPAYGGTPPPLPVQDATPGQT